MSPPAHSNTIAPLSSNINARPSESLDKNQLHHKKSSQQQNGHRRQMSALTSCNSQFSELDSQVINKFRLKEEISVRSPQPPFTFLPRISVSRGGERAAAPTDFSNLPRRGWLLRFYRDALTSVLNKLTAFSLWKTIHYATDIG